MSGPLSGIKVVEFAGLGPAPFCCMMLSDFGADVLQIDRPGAPPSQRHEVMTRGRQHLPLDLKRPEAAAAALAAIECADVLIEGFRPGVMERLGLGPEVALARNRRLVYGRMTGWGQTGRYAQTAGHDINYIAISGALQAIGPAAHPIPPLNLVGDFGGGALYLAFGVVAALLHARATGQGQVIDSAISDGAASLMAMLYGYQSAGKWRPAREANRLDGAAPFYRCYACADGLWIAVGALEPQFFALLVDRLGVDVSHWPDRLDPACWPAMTARFAAVIATRTRDEWCAVFADTDGCVTPVLSMSEAPHDPHNVMRETFVAYDGVIQPAPAPRFSATPGAIQPRRGPDALIGTLERWGLTGDAIQDLGRESGKS